MNKFTFWLFAFFISSQISAQCLTSVNGQWPTNPYTPPVCDGATVNTVTTCGYASEYSVVNVVAGETYTFASSVATDVITISTDMGATASAFGTGSVTWVSTVTGAIYFYTHTPGCGAASVCRTKTVVCGTPPTTAPDCPTLTAPADMATDLNTTVPISWTAPTTGSSVSSYNVYLGTSTPPTTLLGNVTATSANITGLTPSTTYYWMVTSVNAAGESTGCSIYSFTTVAAPANDACADAIALTTGGVFADNAVTGTNLGATNSAETAPGCASYAGGDVWYTVTVPASGSITVETNPVTGSAVTDTGLAVYSGACGSLTLIECDDDDSASGLFSLVSLTGLTPGDVLYVNVWEYGNNAFGEFQVSAYDCPSATPAPTGDANQTICDSGTLADLDVTGTSIIWYDAQTGGNVLADTTALVDGVTYYASQTINCESFDRLAVTVVVSASPVVNNYTLEQCDDDTDGFASFDLTAADSSISTETGVDFTYYPSATDANDETNEITSPYTNTSANQIIYVRVENADDCYSIAELTLTVNPVSVAPTGDANQIFCDETLADLVVSGTNLIWYDAETGGNVLPDTTTLVDGTTYYVSQTTNGCESIDRLAITVAEDCPCLTSVNGQWPTNPYTPPVCDGATVNTVTTCGYASEYSVVNVVAGETYTFASSVATDVITISTDMGATASAFGTGSVTWVSTVTGAIYFYTHTPGCGAASVCRTKTVVCGTPPTTAPDCPTLTAPADMATDLNTTVPISWTAPTTGSSVSSYNVYLGTSTPPTTLLGNVTATSANITGLTPSTTYYWMVTSVNAAGESTGCSIYSFTTVAAPANDACADAIALTTGGVFADNAVTGTNLGATNSAETAPGCASYAGGDVWYTVTVPASGSITVETNPVTGSAVTDTGLAVYSGACGSLTLIECDDDDSASGLFSLVSLTGLTPGDVLYVNVWEYGNNAFGEFQVSAYDASLSTATFDNNSFMLYPNPVRDVLNLSYSSNITSVRVANMLGQMVINKNINANQTQLDMSHLQSGAYIVTVVMDNIEKVVKVIKQ